MLSDRRSSNSGTQESPPRITEIASRDSVPKSCPPPPPKDLLPPKTEKGEMEIAKKKEDTSIPVECAMIEPKPPATEPIVEPKATPIAIAPGKGKGKGSDAKAIIPVKGKGMGGRRTNWARRSAVSVHTRLCTRDQERKRKRGRNGHA